MPALSDLLQILRRKAAILFPQINLWYTKKKVDREERVENYRKQLEDTLAESDRDLEPIVVEAEEAHRSELERGRELDSKAGRYVGNTGVVLSVIGLTPILSVVLGLSDGRVLSATWPHLFILSVLTYSVISLLCSAYYSTKALQMRPYSAYFTADAIQNRIEEGCREDTEVVKELLVGKKKNEEHNIEKSNYISVSESCSLNGLIGLGVGFGLTAVLSLPLI